jgi:hypothetical protein
MRIAAALLTMVVVALGQDCRDCPSAPCSKSAQKATSSLSGTIAKLEASAAKGCKTSEAKLTALTEAAGATDTADLKAKVAAYETYAPAGCAPASKPVVSGRVSLLLATASKGDARSKDILMKLCAECCPPGCCGDDAPKGCGGGAKGCGNSSAEGCGKEFGAKLIGQIKTLEASAAEGSRESIAKLAKLQAVLATLPTTSSRVAALVAGASKGDAKSKAILKGLCEECCPQGGCGDECTKECGKACGTDLVGQIRKLEGSAARGCEKSAAKLVQIDAKLESAVVSKPAAKKDCTGCLPEGCPDGPTKQ